MSSIAFFLCLWGVVAPISAAVPPGRLSLNEFARRLGCDGPVADNGALAISNATHSLFFFPGRRKIKANGVEVWMNSSLDGASSNEQRHIAGVDGELLKWALMPDADSTNRALRVMIDAGHGGVDSGAVSADGSVLEKTLTLEMALQLGEMLRERGFEVCFTRTNDIAVAKSERVKLAKKQGAELFVSIHCNKAPNVEACGAETYILPARGFAGTAEGSKKHSWQPGNRSDVENMMAAYEIQKAFVTNGTFRVDRGIRRQAFYVLRAAQCPAVLVEVGFISHARELRKLTNYEWRERQMRAVADGIGAYSRRLCAYRRINAATIARLEKEERERELEAQRRAQEAKRLAEEAERKRIAAQKELARLEQEERRLAEEAAKTAKRASELEAQLAKKEDESDRIAKELAELERNDKQDGEAGFISEEAIYLMHFYELRPGDPVLPHASVAP